MKLGIFAKTFGYEKPRETLLAALHSGYDVVQYNMACSGLGALPTYIPPDAVEALAAAVRETGIRVAAISATYNMIEPDRQKRESGRRSFKAIAAAAGRLGIPIVTVCTGSLDPADQWRRHPGNDLVEAWDTMVAEFRLLVSIAEREGVLIGVEPELANVVSSPERARRLLDLFAAGPVRIVLDPANLFEHGAETDVQDVVRSAIRLLGADIALAHAKDRSADGTVLAAGKGIVDFRMLVGSLRDVGFDGPLVTHGLSDDEAAGVAAFLKPIIEPAAA